MIDLKELMEQRSDGHQALATSRLAAVQRRIARRRARRVVAGGVAVAVATLAVYLVVPGGEPPAISPGDGAGTQASASVAPSPAVSTKPVAGRKIGPFEEYRDGYRVVAMEQAPVSARKVQVDWTVGAADVGIYTYCPGLPKSSSLLGTVAVDGVEVAEIGCYSDSPFFAEQQRLSGQPSTGGTATVTYTVVGSSGRSKGTIYVAVAEKVAFADFPLPSRPASPRPPQTDGMASEPGTKVVHSDPDDPNRPVATTLTWNQSFDFFVKPQTPGIYTVSVNGMEVLSDEVYDYSGNGVNRSCQASEGSVGGCVAGLDVSDGTTVTITVTARYATGPWLAQLRSQR